ncbi:MAG: CPBP family intramembrane metalloprotease [Planctomycetes bacterium]|nr:CPBP family intramembrane metalloprotease [Planctomycetota bacterium]
MSVAAMGARASAADEATDVASTPEPTTTFPAFPLVVLATAIVLAMIAFRRRWLALDGRPGLNWAASPMHLMGMCVATWLAGGVATLVAARALGLDGTIDPAALTVREMAIVTAAAMGAGMMAALGLLAWMRRMQVVPHTTAAPIRSIMSGVAMLMVWWPAIASAGWVAGQLQRAVTGIEPPSIGHSTLEQMVQGTRDAWWWLMGLSAVVLAPILEECLYRGFVQQALRRAGLGPWPAVLLASIVFTLMHVGSVPEGARAASLTSLAVLACCFGWLAERTGSLVAPIAAHVAFNLGNLVMATAFA